MNFNSKILSYFFTFTLFLVLLSFVYVGSMRTISYIDNSTTQSEIQDIATTIAYYINKNGLPNPKNASEMPEENRVLKWRANDIDLKKQKMEFILNNPNNQEDMVITDYKFIEEIVKGKFARGESYRKGMYLPIVVKVIPIEDGNVERKNHGQDRGQAYQIKISYNYYILSMKTFGTLIYSPFVLSGRTGEYTTTTYVQKYVSEGWRNDRPTDTWKGDGWNPNPNLKIERIEEGGERDFYLN